jgi:type I restriction enzyme R subunit
MLKHFLEHPDPNGFKAQLVAVDRKACALYKIALDSKLKAERLPPEWSDVIISEAQNSEPEVEQFEYPKVKQDELIEYFKLTPAEWEAWNRERYFSVGLRGVAVVRRDGAPRPREELT